MGKAYSSECSREKRFDTVFTSLSNGIRSLLMGIRRKIHHRVPNHPPLVQEPHPKTKRHTAKEINAKRISQPQLRTQSCALLVEHSSHRVQEEANDGELY